MCKSVNSVILVLGIDAVSGTPTYMHYLHVCRYLWIKLDHLPLQWKDFLVNLMTTIALTLTLTDPHDAQPDDVYVCTYFTSLGS